MALVPRRAIAEQVPPARGGGGAPSTPRDISPAKPALPIRQAEDGGISAAGLILLKFKDARYALRPVGPGRVQVSAYDMASGTYSAERALLPQEARELPALLHQFQRQIEGANSVLDAEWSTTRKYARAEVGIYQEVNNKRLAAIARLLAALSPPSAK